MKDLFSGLRFRLMLVVFLGVLPALFFILYGNWRERQQSAVYTQEKALYLVRQISSNQDDLIEATRLLLIALAKIPEVRQHDRTKSPIFLHKLIKIYQFYTNMGIIGSDGRLLVSALPFTQSITYADREWFARIKQTRCFTVSNYLIGRVTGKPNIILSYPILNTKGNITRIFSVSLDLAWLYQTVDKAQFPKGSVMAVIDRTGTILAHYPDSGQWIGKNYPGSPVIKTILAQKKQGVFEKIGLDGIPRLYAFCPLSERPEVGAYVYVGVPIAVAYSEADRILFRKLILLGLVTILAGAAAWWLGGLFILHPINQLIETTRRLTEGDLTARTSLPYKGEIGKLSWVFDQMADTLQQRQAERDQAEEQLRRSQEMRLLDQITTGVAHEVRNPLNALLSITEALFKDLGDNPEYQPYLEHIRNQVNRLSFLMKDLLELGRPVQPERFQYESLSEILASVAGLWQETNIGKRHRISVFIPSEAERIQINTDPIKLQQVFFNLLDNAAQNNPEGSEICLDLYESNGEWCKVRIVDQGAGIPVDNLPRVFDPFFTTRNGGTGLGLSLVKGFVESMGGRVNIRNNDPPPGCTVELMLPIAEGAEL